MRRGAGASPPTLRRRHAVIGGKTGHPSIRGPPRLPHCLHSQTGAAPASQAAPACDNGAMNARCAPGGTGCPRPVARRLVQDATTMIPRGERITSRGRPSRCLGPVWTVSVCGSPARRRDADGAGSSAGPTWEHGLMTATPPHHRRPRLEEVGRSDRKGGRSPEMPGDAGHAHDPRPPQVAGAAEASCLDRPPAVARACGYAAEGGAPKGPLRPNDVDTNSWRPGVRWGSAYGRGLPENAHVPGPAYGRGQGLGKRRRQRRSDPTKDATEKLTPSTRRALSRAKR